MKGYTKEFVWASIKGFILCNDMFNITLRLSDSGVFLFYPDNEQDMFWLYSKDMDGNIVDTGEAGSVIHTADFFTIDALMSMEALTIHHSCHDNGSIIIKDYDKKIIQYLYENYDEVELARLFNYEPDDDT